jgi:hypothetical protein
MKADIPTQDASGIKDTEILCVVLSSHDASIGDALNAGTHLRFPADKVVYHLFPVGEWEVE